jgi:hypothetical protein
MKSLVTLATEAYMKAKTTLYSAQLTAREQTILAREARIAGTSKAGMLRIWLHRAEAERKARAKQ